MKKLLLLSFVLVFCAAVAVYSGTIDVSPFLRGIEIPGLAGDNQCAGQTRTVAWYNLSSNKLRACENGSAVDLVGGGIAANPAGSNTQIQFNNNGSFQGDPGLTYDQVTDTLMVGALSATTGIVGGNAVVTTNDSRLSDQRTPPDGSVTTTKIADGNVTGPKLATGAVDASKASTASATDLGNTNAAGSASSLARSDHVHKRTVRIKKAGSDIAIRNAINLIEGSNVTLTVADDSANDEVDVTIAASGGGAGLPGGSDTQVQFNDAGGFQGDAGFVYNKTTDTATLVNLIVTTLTCTGCIGTTQVAGLDAGDVTTGIFGQALMPFTKADVRLVATGNGTLATAYENGDTLDGVTLATGDRILLTGQSAGAENGIRVVAASGAPARATDADTAAEYTPFEVFVKEGSAGNLGSTWKHTTPGAITLDTTPLTFVKTGVGPTAERTGNKNVNSGYAGLDGTGSIGYDRLATQATATLSAASQLTISARQMLIDGNAGPVDLTSDPQIVAGAKDGIETIICGAHATNTVKFDNGTGVRLIGNTGSVTVGLNLPCQGFRWNATLTVWQQLQGSDLQQLFNVSNKVQTGNSAATGYQIGDVTGGNYCSIFYDGANSNFPTIQCFCGGSSCDLKQIVQTGKLGQLFSNTDEIWRLTESTDTFDFVGGQLALRGGTGAPTGTDCDAAGEARRVWLQTDASPECQVWVCNGTAWKNQCGVKSACMVRQNIVAADDNRLFGSVDKDITVKSAWCHYEGSAPTTAATFSLVGMTHTAPTCAGPTAQATKQTVTAGGSVTARTPIRWSVTNTPNPTTDTYELCLGYDIN